MKITTIEIKMEPNEVEIGQGRTVRILSRGLDKLWTVNSGGLFSNELILAEKIQEIIMKYNGNQI